MFYFLLTGNTTKHNYFKNDEELIKKVIEKNLATIIVEKITFTSTIFFVPCFRSNMWNYTDLLFYGEFKNHHRKELKNFLDLFVKQSVQDLKYIDNLLDKVEKLKQNWYLFNIDNNYENFILQNNQNLKTWETLTSEELKVISLYKDI